MSTIIAECLKPMAIVSAYRECAQEIALFLKQRADLLSAISQIKCKKSQLPKLISARGKSSPLSLVTN